MVWDGSAFGVAWHDYRDNNYEIYFARVDSLGNKLNGGLDSRVSNNGGNSFYADIDWSGSSYGVAWCDNRSGSYNVYYRAVGTDGVPQTGELSVSGGPGTNNSLRPRISWSGSEYGLAWYDNRDSNWEIYFSRVTSGGTPVGGDVRISHDPNVSAYPDIEWNGGSFGITWIQDTGGGVDEIMFQRVLSDGTTVNPSYQVTSTGGNKGDYWGARLEWNGNSFAAVWYDDTVPANNEIYAVGIHPLGYSSTGVLRLTNDSAYSTYPAVSWDGARFGVAWQDSRPGNYELYFSLFELDRDGDALADASEEALGTSPSDWDSDGDGMDDGWESAYACLNALAGDSSADPDGDGDSNLVEYGNSTDPCFSVVTDSDGDGLEDSVEDSGCTDSLDPDSDGDGLCDGNVDVYDGATLLCSVGEDLDLDGVVDATETSPCAPDSDGDGVNDGDEVLTWSTDPLWWDSDGDALPDAFEIAHIGDATPLDPLYALDGLTSDFDGDGNPNTHEYYNGSDIWTLDPTGEPGCRYWADSGAGEGIMGPGDLTNLEMELSAPGSGDYSGVIPDNADTQELSGEGIMGPGDLTLLERILKNEVIGSELGSRPVGISAVDVPPGPVSEGSTCHVSVVVDNEYGSVSSGFGVVFEIDPSSTGEATLLGGDGDSVSGGRYDVSCELSLGATSTIVIRVDVAGTIVINAGLPQCGGGAGGPGRSHAPVSLSPAATIIGE